MKHEILKCYLIEVGALKETKGIDDEMHISLTGIFQERATAGTHSGATSFSLNVRKNTNLGIFKSLLKISQMTEDSPEREKAIDEYNASVTLINYMSETCPMYFVHKVVKGVPEINTHGPNHPRTPKQPITATRIVDYWLESSNADTPEERFLAKKKAITNLNMFVTGETAKEVISNVTNQQVKKLMERAATKMDKMLEEEDEVEIIDTPTEKEEKTENASPDSEA